MKTYLLTAAAVIFLSVIVSLIIPQGKLNKTIVFVMRMACILVLIQPITGIFKIKASSEGDVLYDTEYVATVYSKNQSGSLEKLLYDEFAEECECKVNVVYVGGNFKVDSVSVQTVSENNQIIEDIYEYLEELGYINITVYAKSS
ncbi:MAG: stage III sporulation protein AF [Clostridia bacterium]|nr:stage III sporulation protein AF [Clostridia bacterium]